MRTRSALFGILLCLLCVGCSASSQNVSLLQSLVPEVDAPHHIAGIPARLSIPSLGIDAAVEHVGLTPEGDMDIPKDPWKVGWYMLGARPGEPGNAVMAGHLDSLTGKAVFWDLKKLQPGDEMTVTDDTGEEHTFVVMESEIFDYKTAPLEEIFGKSDEKRLNLITCEGTWNTRENRYSQRLTVFAEKIES